MQLGNLSGKVKKAISAFRTTTVRIFQRNQQQDKHLIHSEFNLHSHASGFLQTIQARSSELVKRVPDAILIAFAVMSIFAVWPTGTLLGSSLTDILLRLIGAVGVNVLSGLLINFYDRRNQNLADEKAGELQKQVEPVLQEALKADPRRKVLIRLVVLAFVSTALAIFQWRQAQQNANEARTAEAEARAQAEIAQGETMQADRLSSANSEIIKILIESNLDPIAQGEKFSEIGDIYQSRGLFEDALDSQNQALIIYQRVKYSKGQRLIVNKIGQIYQSKGQQDQALIQYRIALDLQQGNDDRAGDGITLNNIGSAYQSQGQYELALRSYEDAKEAYEEIEDQIGQGLTINNIGSIYQDLGNSHKAQELYEQALDVFKKEDAKAEVGRTLRYIGSLYASQEYTQALRYYEDALAIYREIKRRIDEGRTLTDIGDVYQQHNNHQQALNFYNDAQKIHEQLNNRSDLGRTFNGIGDTFRNQHKYSEALEYYQQALDNQQNVNDRLGQVNTHEDIGQVYEELDEMDQAIIEYQRSIKLLEAVLNEIRIEEFKTSFVDRHLQSYEHLIRLLWQEERFFEAFNYVERARSRAFLDQISDSRVNFRNGVDFNLLTQEQELRNQMNIAQKGLREQGKSIDLRNTWLTNQEALFNQYEDLLVRLKLASPKYQNQNSNDPVSTKEELQGKVLDKNVTLIEYFVIDEQILAWVIDRDNFQPIELTISRSAIKAFTNKEDGTTKDLIDQLFNIIATKDFDRELSAFLYENLFAPLEPHIRHNNLIIVPHSIFHKLPFAALWNAKTQRYLIEDYALSFAPSANALRFILNRRNPNERRFLGLGSGSFASTEDEIREIAKLYAATPYIGEDATESKLNNQVGESDILYIASDAAQNSAHPLFSYVALTPDDESDGNLEVNEIYDLDLTQINLVVLSGPGTSLGSITLSDEIVGFNRAFLSAGSPAVISTAWKIDGISTAELMKSFYRYLLLERKTVSEALQAAQKDFLRKNDWSAPFYWAAFTLTGDYRGGEPLETTLEENR